MFRIAKNTWTAFRDLVLAKDLIWQFDETTDLYDIYAVDTGVIYAYRMKKDGGTDQTDWQDNYKALANKAIPQKRSTFSVGQYRFRGDAKSGTCAAGTSSTVDHTLAEKRLLSGGCVVVKGAEILDTVKFQVVAADGTTVLDEYVTKWFVNPTLGGAAVSMDYAGAVLATWKLRMIYTADSAGSTRTYCVNYLLHKPI